jgi:hypothetical protein
LVFIIDREERISRTEYRVVTSVQSPPVLLFQAGQDGASQRIGELLMATGSRELSGITDVQTSLDSIPTAVVVLVYENPVAAVARLLGSGLGDALRRWQDSIEPALTIYRGNRRRLLLVDSSAAAASAPLFAEELDRRLGISFHPAQMARVPADTASEPIDPTVCAVANACIRWCDTASRLAEELTASSLPLPVPRPAEPSALIDAWGELEAAATHRDRLLEDMTLQRMQLEQVREELEGYHGKLERLQEDRTLLRSQLEQAREELEGHNVNLERQQEDRTLLQMQLEQAREELESYYGKSAMMTATAKELDATRKSLDRTSGQLEAVLASQSWKITAPLRLLLRPFLGKSDL